VLRKSFDQWERFISQARRLQGEGPSETLGPVDRFGRSGFGVLSDEVRPVKNTG